MAVLGAAEPRLLPIIFQAYEDERVTDTMIRQKLIDIAEGKYRRFFTAEGKVVKVSYGLDALCLRHLGFVLPKTEIRLNFYQLRGSPIAQWPELAREYALGDAAVTSAIFDAQEEDRWARYLRDQYRQTAAAWWIHLMGVWGIRTDADGVKAFAEELQLEHDEVFAALQKVGLMRSNGTRDTKAAKDRMRVVCARKELGVTLKNQVSLSADHCNATGDEILMAYSRISSLKKQLSTDIPLLEMGVLVPIHARFESIVETGRTSSRPNLQNLPVYGKMRECFVPREGHVFASADYDGFELRTMAQVCVKRFGASRLAEALNAGADPHLVVASQILKLPFAETKSRYLKGDDEIYRARQTGKVANFGFPGGLGAKKLSVWAKKSYNVDLTEEQARGLKDHWLEAWPEFNAFFARISEICETETPQIVQLISGRFRGDVTFTEACNSEFQGLASDAAKCAGFLISKACYVESESPLYGSRIVNFVHDEFILETPVLGASKAAEELARLMVVGASRFLPDVPPKATPLLMCRWSKRAKPVYKNGELVPWEICNDEQAV